MDDKFRNIPMNNQKMPGGMPPGMPGGMPGGLPGMGTQNFDNKSFLSKMYQVKKNESKKNKSGTDYDKMTKVFS